ncbi:MAG: hypothetical protein RIT27_1457 [Pseudomonadota bacterium]
MKSFVQFISFVGMLSVSTLYAADKPQVELQTTKGTIVFEMMPDKAPKSVENFLAYVKDGFYENTIIHRIIPDYMIQGGGYDDKQTKKETSHPPVENEANNGVKNTKGTVAVARKNEPHSGTSQFFINMANNEKLNYTGTTDSKSWGYAVFAKVIKGMDILEQMQDVETNPDGAFKYSPVDHIIIEKVTLLSKESSAKSDKKTDKKVDKKADKKVEKKDAAPLDDQAAKDAAEDAADAAADKAAKKPEQKGEKKEIKSDKKADKKTEKKDAAPLDDQAAQDAAEDAADAAADKAEADKAAKKPEQKGEKKDPKADKKTEKKVEKKSEQKTTKVNSPAPDEPAVE